MYRQPRESDIGIRDRVEVAFNEDDWGPACLNQIIHVYKSTRYRVWVDNLGERECTKARVKIDTTDAVEQLNVAADYVEGTLAEQVLRVAAMMDAESLRRLLTYQEGRSISVFETDIDKLREASRKWFQLGIGGFLSPSAVLDESEGDDNNACQACLTKPCHCDTAELN